VKSREVLFFDKNFLNFFGSPNISLPAWDDAVYPTGTGSINCNAGTK
jgi:hypothetical protein